MTERASSLDVVVVGGAAMDWVAEVKALPARDELVVADALTRFPGGSAANVAVGVARLGWRVGFVGKLGDDAVGRVLLQAFDQEGVETGHVLIEAGRETSACFIGLDSQGERMIFGLPGVSLIEDPSELNPAYFLGARVLYIGPSYPPLARAAATTGRENRSTIVFAPGGGWDPAGLSAVRETLQLTDVLLVSEVEALQLTGQPSLTAALHYLEKLGPSVIVATCGANGAQLMEGGRRIEMPAVPAPAVRDTTGAGDAFAAGLVAGFLEGRSWADAARYGNVAAALKVGQLGARNGLPSRRELEQAMTKIDVGRGSR